MIRLKGFARKTERSTKGGSLPTPDNDRHPRTELNMGNNGHHNGNGATPAPRTHSNDELSDSSSRLAAGGQRNGDGLRSYFRHIVEQLVDPRPPIEGVPPLDR